MPVGAVSAGDSHTVQSQLVVRKCCLVAPSRLLCAPTDHENEEQGDTFESREAEAAARALLSSVDQSANASAPAVVPPVKMRSVRNTLWARCSQVFVSAKLRVQSGHHRSLDPSHLAWMLPYGAHLAAVFGGAAQCH